jgi:hypothetical protein
MGAHDSAGKDDCRAARVLDTGSGNAVHYAMVAIDVFFHLCNGDL